MMAARVLRSCVIMHAINLASKSPSECLGTRANRSRPILHLRLVIEGNCFHLNSKACTGDQSSYVPQWRNERTDGRWCEELITRASIKVPLCTWFHEFLDHDWSHRVLRDCHPSTRTRFKAMLISNISTSSPSWIIILSSYVNTTLFFLKLWQSRRDWNYSVDARKKLQTRNNFIGINYVTRITLLNYVWHSHCATCPISTNVTEYSS